MRLLSLSRSLCARARHGSLTLALLAASSTVTWAATPAVEASSPTRSALDAPLLMQLLIGEFEADAGRSARALDLYFDAARRTGDEALFKRALQMALQTRSGDDVQAVVGVWRKTLPQSIDAVRYQLQIALGMNRVTEAVEPFTALVERSPVDERNDVIGALPSLLERAGERAHVARTFEPALRQLASTTAQRAAALTTLGRLWLAAGDTAQAMAIAQQAHDADPNARDPVGLALELMGRDPRAEALVRAYLDRPQADPALRVGYGQALAQQQRNADALRVLRDAVAAKPDSAAAWLTLGALHLELRRPREAEEALQRYLLELADGAPSRASGDEAEAIESAGRATGRSQAYLMLSQAAELRGDFTAATAWLDRIDADGSRALDVRLRRATMLAKQGKLAEARATVRAAPEVAPQDARNKVIAESQVLREVKRWQDAHDVLADGARRFPKDVDLLYEQAMMAEKLDRMDQMEVLLKQVMTERPDHQHAYNALGYSLADRGLRLQEARSLVSKALELAPGDPFITDSLGWVEYRLGNRDEAIRLLRQAWAKRPDTEIGAHLGEVLWVSGQRDEARRVWRESKGRDADNEVLRETLARLKVDL